jgi:hypothetical protein
MKGYDTSTKPRLTAREANQACRGGLELFDRLPCIHKSIPFTLSTANGLLGMLGLIIPPNTCWLTIVS